MRGSVVKRGKMYSIVYYVDKKQKWEKAGTNKHEAEKLLAERIAQVNRGEFAELKPITFAEFTERWLKQYAEGGLKPSSFEAYRSKVKHYLVPFFGAKDLTKITLEDCQGLVTKMRETGFSAATIGMTVTILKELFKHAVRWGYLRQNPAQYVEKPPIRQPEMDYFTTEEVRVFLETTKVLNPDWYPFFLTAIMTGMRRGELLAMKWANLDWRRRQYFVKESYYLGRFDEPKSERSKRAINLPPMVMDTLAELHERQGQLRQQTVLSAQANFQDYDLIFCQLNGKPWDPDWVGQHAFKRTLRAAGIREIRFHDLRHTFVALLIAQGESSKYIQSQLGHSSIQITLDRYGHLMPETNELAALRLENQLFGSHLSKTLAITESPQVAAM